MITLFQVGVGKVAKANDEKVFVKSNLTKVTYEEIKKHRCKAYKYLI